MSTENTQPPPISDRLVTLYPDDQPKADAEPYASQAKTVASTTTTTPADPTEILYLEDQPKTAEADADKPNVTVSGEYTLSAPVGFEIDPVAMSAATPVFRELGLKSDQAQKLVAPAMKLIERYQQRQADEFAAVIGDWGKMTAKDPEIGGKNLPETKRLMNVALTAAGVDKKHEFHVLMNESGLGNHPAVLKVFRTLGQKLSRG